MKNKTRETEENVNSTRPAKNVDLDDAVLMFHNVTNDASLLQEIMEETKNSFEKLIFGLGNTFAPAASTHLKSGPPKFGGVPEDVSVEAWVAMIKMYFENQQGGSEKSKVITLLTFLHKSKHRPGLYRRPK